MSKQLCPDCGNPLPLGSPGGLCPACLLTLGIVAAKSEDTPASPAPATGERIGRYQLLEVIGEGAFGIVWMAEQTQPVRRKVALKVIKLGMDTKEVVARFEAERQALALMDHPSIARVLDGGATESGRPYFVMELVKGVCITEYCDARSVTTQERLKLFIEVCQAVQHAHQKGIVHRDLKPSNVLVTEQDGRAVPKVIDFGIAKATEQELTERSFFTRFNQLVGTPAYMSPEQAGLGSLDVDTRSDIYSLGVLLYELLTGQTPFSNAELLRAGLDQVIRIIREQDPPKPSTQLSTLAQADLVAVAQRRGADPSRLNRLVRGELDWIVMKCLEKERGRRYETAIGLARDIERHLNNEPIIARAPGTYYRFQKTVQRNKLVFVAMGGVILALVMGLAISWWMLVRERTAVHEQERLRQLAEVNLQTARQAVDRMLNRLAEQLRAQPHLIGLSRKLVEDALEFHQSFLQQRPEDPQLRHALAQSFMQVGDIYQSLGAFEKSVAPRQRAIELLAEFSQQAPGVAQFREEMALLEAAISYAYHSREMWVEDLRHVRRSRELWEALERDFPDVPRYAAECANAHINVANSIKDKPQRVIEAEKSMAAYTRYRTRFPAEPHDLELEAQIHHWYGHALQEVNRLEEAERAYRRCDELRSKLVEDQPDNPGLKTALAHIKSYLGNLLCANGRLEESLKFHQQAIALEERMLVDYPEYTDRGKRAGDNYRAMAQTLIALGRYAEAETALGRSLDIHTRMVTNVPNEPINRYKVFETTLRLGELLEITGRTNEAAAAFQNVLNGFEAMGRESNSLSGVTWYMRDTMTKVSTFYEKQGRTNQAGEWRRKLAAFDQQRLGAETKPSTP